MRVLRKLIAWLLSLLPQDLKKWLMYAIILGSIPMVAATTWVSFPLSKGWSGLTYSFMEFMQAERRLSLTSYGVLEILALVIGAETYRRQRWELTYWMGATLFLVVLAGTLHLTFGEPAFIKDLLTQVVWQQAAVQFAETYLPPAPVSEPSVMYSLSFDNIAERVQAGWYFMGLGWYVAVAMALALMICGGTSLDRRSVKRARRMTGLVTLGLVAVFLFYPVLGEHDLVMAVRAEAQWHPDEAEKWYEQAIRHDRWNALDLGVHERIGALHQALGRTTTPDYQLYRAEFMVDEQKLPEAIAQYQGIAAGGGPLSRLARDRANELWVTYGLNLYAAGAYGSAVVAWQHAIDSHPTMWIAAFYLTRAYFAVGRYDDAISLAQRSIALTSDPQFLANLYNNFGDAQTRLGALGDAHFSYSRSYYYNYVPNWRALTSLTGSMNN